MRDRLIGVIVALVVVVACTNSPGNTETTDPAPIPEPTQPSAPDTPPGDDLDPPGPAAETSDGPAVVVPAGPAIVDGAANSLVLVYDIDGGDRALVSYRADGTEVADYSGDRANWCATDLVTRWSAGRLGLIGPRRRVGVVSAAVDGTDSTVRQLPGRPDYITYDPTSSRVLAVTPSPVGFGLVIVELGPGRRQTRRRLLGGRSGCAGFSDFAAGGDRLVAHVGRGPPSRRPYRGSHLAASRSFPTRRRSGIPPMKRCSSRATSETVIDWSRSVLETEVTTDLGVVVGFVLFDIDPAGERLAVMSYGNPLGRPAASMRFAARGDDRRRRPASSSRPGCGSSTSTMVGLSCSTTSQRPHRCGTRRAHGCSCVTRQRRRSVEGVRPRWQSREHQSVRHQ